MTRTITPVPVRHQRTVDHPPRGSRVLLGWLLLTVSLAATGVLILAVVSSGPAPQPGSTPNPEGTRSDVPSVSQDGVYAGWPTGVPRSADAAEGWSAQQRQDPAARVTGIPRSADAAERWFVQQAEARAGRTARIPSARLPRSADAAERWFTGGAWGVGR